MRFLLRKPPSTYISTPQVDYELREQANVLCFKDASVI